MKIYFLEQDAIDDIKTNYKKYSKHFLDENNTWFIDYFNKNNWLKEVKNLECEDILMDMNDDFNVSDTKNIKIVYDAMKKLSPAVATDERLWAGLSFTYFWKYIKYRRFDEINSGDEWKVLNSFFFMRGKKRSCFVNCLSRLWWTGYLLYDSSAKNPYEAAELISESAFASKIMLISSNNFVSNKNLALGVLDCIKRRKQAGEKIDRYHYVEANKYINCIGGTQLLDTLSRNEVMKLTNKILNKSFGEINIE